MNFIGINISFGRTQYAQHVVFRMLCCAICRGELCSPVFVGESLIVSLSVIIQGPAFTAVSGHVARLQTALAHPALRISYEIVICASKVTAHSGERSSPLQYVVFRMLYCAICKGELCLHASIGNLQNVSLSAKMQDSVRLNYRPSLFTQRMAN
jgi:hypothetical protein